jgi:hypothetical protein
VRCAKLCPAAAKGLLKGSECEYRVRYTHKFAAAADYGACSSKPRF